MFNKKGFPKVVVVFNIQDETKTAKHEKISERLLKFVDLLFIILQ